MIKEIRKAFLLSALGFAALAVLPATAFAHHSFAQYDASKSRTIEGTIVEYHWVSPHSWIILAVEDENGETVDWTLELESVGNIYRRGWRPDTFKYGDHAVFDVAPMRNGMPGGGVRTVTLDDGTTLVSRDLR